MLYCVSYNFFLRISESCNALAVNFSMVACFEPCFDKTLENRNINFDFVAYFVCYHSGLDYIVSLGGFIISRIKTTEKGEY